MKVALVYDRVNKWGGAERVLLAMKELFPEAPLYTSVCDKKKAFWAKKFRIITSPLQKIPWFRSLHEKIPYLMPLAFESFSFDAYDIIISITSEAAKGVITSPRTLHICYCLTPTRYLWSGYDEYFSNPFFRFITRPIVWYLRCWDLMAADRPDIMIAISQEVQERIKKYYGREAEVIYPPITLFNKDTESGKSESGITNYELQRVTNNHKLIPDNYFLVVSRLVRYKRVDLAIRACNRLKLPLVIIGTGSEEKKLRKIAGSTIYFLRDLTDEEVIAYYKQCIALIFPGQEDFGLTILEAESIGKPVVAYKSGGAKETIIEGITGEFFTSQTVDSLCEKLQFLYKKCIVTNKGIVPPYSKEKMHELVSKFSKEIFKEKFFALIERHKR